MTNQINRVDRRLWLANQIDQDDPRRGLARGGLDPPNDKFYRNNGKPIQNWSPHFVYQAFNITIEQYLEAEADIVQFLKGKDENGKDFWKREWDWSLEVELNHCFEHLLDNYDWLNELDTGVPWWFLAAALPGWVRTVKTAMERSKDFRDGYQGVEKFRKWHQAPAVRTWKRKPMSQLHEISITITRNDDHFLDTEFGATSIMELCKSSTEAMGNEDEPTSGKLTYESISFEKFLSFIKRNTSYNENVDKIIVERPLHQGETEKTIVEVSGDASLQTAVIYLHPRKGEEKKIEFVVQRQMTELGTPPRNTSDETDSVPSRPPKTTTAERDDAAEGDEENTNQEVEMQDNDVQENGGAQHGAQQGDDVQQDGGAQPDGNVQDGGARQDVEMQGGGAQEHTQQDAGRQTGKRKRDEEQDEEQKVPVTPKNKRWALRSAASMKHRRFF